MRPPWLLFRGGPDWPHFWLRMVERHRRGRLGLPLDLPPRRGEGILPQREASGVWCGPVVPHFGHAIASFGGRLAWASTLPDAWPLVFSARRDEGPPAFFWDLLAHFGVSPGRVRIVDRPTRFATLLVGAEAERHGAGPASHEYLALLDRLAGPAPASDGSRLFVSRARLWKGKIAGEAYLERVLAATGTRIFHLEAVSVAEQIAAYRMAGHLVFSEGSALHALQLVGSLQAKVTVITRRAGSRLAEAALRPRVRSLRYVDAVSAVVMGANRAGRSQPSAGMSLLDPDRLVAGLKDAGIDIAAEWSRPDFARQRDEDVCRWMGARGLNPPHPRDAMAIRRSLAQAGLAHLAALEGVRPGIQPAG